MVSKIKEKIENLSQGVGFIFYISLVLVLWVNLVYWGSGFDQQLKNLSFYFGSGFYEWLFLSFCFPVISWFWCRKEKRDRWKEYKKKTSFSGRVAKSILRRKKPLSVHEFAHREYGLDDIQIYLRLLTNLGVLREIPRNQNESLFIPNEAAIKKSPTKLQHYYRSSPPLFVSIALSILLMALVSYLFPSLTFVNLHSQTSMFSKFVVENSFETFIQINQFNKVIFMGIASFFFIAVVFLEKKLLNKWKGFQDKKRQKTLLQLAKKNSGRLNSAAVCLALGLPLHKARGYLDFLQTQGYAKINYDENGHVYHQITI